MGLGIDVQMGPEDSAEFQQQVVPRSSRCCVTGSSNSARHRDFVDRAALSTANDGFRCWGERQMFPAQPRGTRRTARAPPLVEGRRLALDVTAAIPVEQHDLDPNRISGVDLGIIHPIAIASDDAGMLLGPRTASRGAPPSGRPESPRPATGPPPRSQPTEAAGGLTPMEAPPRAPTPS
jgi:hypothetical protein